MRINELFNNLKNDSLQRFLNEINDRYYEISAVQSTLEMKGMLLSLSLPFTHSLSLFLPLSPFSLKWLSVSSLFQVILALAVSTTLSFFFTIIFCLSLVYSCPYSLSLSLSPLYTHSPTHEITQILMHPNTHISTHTLTHTHTHQHTHTHMGTGCLYGKSWREKDRQGNSNEEFLCSVSM